MIFVSIIILLHMDKTLKHVAASHGYRSDAGKMIVNCTPTCMKELVVFLTVMIANLVAHRIFLFDPHYIWTT